MEWRDKAKCWGTDPEIFAALSGSIDEGRAIAICAACPVRLACLDEALAESDDATIRGGYTPAERRALMRGRLEIDA